MENLCLSHPTETIFLFCHPVICIDVFHTRDGLIVFSFHAGETANLHKSAEFGVIGESADVTVNTGKDDTL